MNNINMHIGQRVKQRRLELGLTQDELANLVGYNKRFSITRIESGQNAIPTKKLDKFAEVLHTTVSYLLGKENEDEYYYLNQDTKKIAKKAYERKSIRDLFDAVEDLPDKDIETCSEFIKKIKR